MENTKKTNPTTKILKILLNSIFYLIVIVLLLFSIITMSAKTPKDVPNLFGRGYLSVRTDSMDGNEKNSFKVGDLIFVKTLKEKDLKKLKVGDIVTWYEPTLQSLNSHRIVHIDGDTVITQGDKAIKDNPNNAFNPENPTASVPFEANHISDIKAVYTGKIPTVGRAMFFMQTRLGFGLMVLLPIALILIYQITALIINIFRANNQKMQAAHAIEKEKALKELELEKEKMRQELLEEMKEKEKKDKKPKKDKDKEV